MVCCLFGAKPLSKLIFFFVNWTLGKTLQWGFNQKHFFINEKALENVACWMVVIFLALNILNLLGLPGGGDRLYFYIIKLLKIYFIK